MKGLMLFICVLLSACDSPIVPVRVLRDVYDYRLLTPAPKTLRWPTNTTVRVFVVPDAVALRTQYLHEAVDNAINVWNQAVLYGEVELVEASSVQEADAVVRYSNSTPPIELSNCPTGNALAVTTFCLTSDGRHLQTFPLTNGTPSQVKFVVTINVPLQASAELVSRLVTHEMGHVLGIGQHSPNPEDLMYFDALSRTDPSETDRATLQVLYHTQADITP